MKRFIDFVLSFLGLLILSPLFGVLALIIKVSSKGTVFFRQTRVGRNGHEFQIMKFRTMQDKPGTQITIGKDPRITKVGHILRQTKLDEIPQLWNILVGDMSFVGPRPEVPKYVALYTSLQRQVLSVRPGITDIASIKYRNEAELLEEADDPERTYIEVIMPDKLALNLEYIERMSVLYDFRIILSTLWRVINPGSVGQVINRIERNETGSSTSK